MHDLTAARIWGIIRELAAAGLIVLADTAARDQPIRQALQDQDERLSLGGER